MFVLSSVQHFTFVVPRAIKILSFFKVITVSWLATSLQHGVSLASRFTWKLSCAALLWLVHEITASGYNCLTMSIHLRTQATSVVWLMCNIYVICVHKIIYVTQSNLFRNNLKISGGCASFGHSCFGGHGKRSQTGDIIIPAEMLASRDASKHNIPSEQDDVSFDRLPYTYDFSRKRDADVKSLLKKLVKKN